MWCEVWNLDDRQIHLILATLNRLRGVDDTQKRVHLISTLYKEYDGDKDLLLKLLPESEKSLSAILKMGSGDIEGTLEEMEAEKGIIADKLTQVVDQDEAQRLSHFYKYPDDGKARLTFVFENEDDYIEALKYFGRKPDTLKLLELIGINKQD